VEWTIFSENLGASKWIGTFDALVFDVRTGEILLLDWKLSACADRRYGRSMKHPLEHMEDTKMRRHYLQLNSYRRVLEQDYGIVIARMCVIVFHAAMDEWAVYPVPLLEDEVDAMFQHGLRDVPPPPPPKATTPNPAITAEQRLGQLPASTPALTHVRGRGEGLPRGVTYNDSNGRPDRPWEAYSGGIERVPGLVAVDEAGYLRCCAGGTTADGKRKPCREAEEWDLVRVVCCAKDA
jgi:hypothetical protein